MELKGFVGPLAAAASASASASASSGAGAEGNKDHLCKELKQAWHKALERTAEPAGVEPPKHVVMGSENFLRYALPPAGQREGGKGSLGILRRVKRALKVKGAPDLLPTYMLAEALTIACVARACSWAANICLIVTPSSSELLPEGFGACMALVLNLGGAPGCVKLLTHR